MDRTGELKLSPPLFITNTPTAALFEGEESDTKNRADNFKVVLEQLGDYLTHIRNYMAFLYTNVSHALRLQLNIHIRCRKHEPSYGLCPECLQVIEH